MAMAQISSKVIGAAMPGMSNSAEAATKQADIQIVMK